MTKKAGCFLINTKNRSVALVYREKQNDYSFPKGHLEEGETLFECALREVAEETKREALILNEYPPYIEKYTTPNGEDCECYMFFALDLKASNNASLDTHPTFFIDIDEIRDKLTYPSLKKMWDEVKPIVIEIIKKDYK